MTFVKVREWEKVDHILKKKMLQVEFFYLLPSPPISHTLKSRPQVFWGPLRLGYKVTKAVVFLLSSCLLKHLHHEAMNEMERISTNPCSLRQIHSSLTIFTEILEIANVLHLLQDTIQERTNGKSNISEEEGLSELIPFSLVWKLPASSQVLSGWFMRIHVSIVILTCYCLSRTLSWVYREYPTEHWEGLHNWVDRHFPSGWCMIQNHARIKDPFKVPDRAMNSNVME